MYMKFYRILSIRNKEAKKPVQRLFLQSHEIKHRLCHDGPHSIIRVVEGFLSDTVAVEKIHRAALGEHDQDLPSEKVWLVRHQAVYRVHRSVATVLRCHPLHNPV